MLQRKNINYLIAGRFLIGIGIFLSITTVNLLYPFVFKFKSLYAIILLILILSIIYFFLNQKEIVSKSFLVKIQLLIDIVLINALIYVSGVSESPFIFLLALPIIIASLFLDKKSTILIGALSFLLLTIIILFYFTFISKIELFEYLNRLILYALSFTGIAILSTYLSDSIKRYGEEIEKKKEELERFNRLLQSIIENIDYGFIATDIDKNIIFKNKKIEKMFNNTITDFISLFDFQDIEQNYFKEITFKNRIYRVNIEKFSFEKGDHFIMVIEDLTKEKEEETKKRIEEKLLYLGEIAAGMAHEIRNPLASLMASVQVLKEEDSSERDNSRLKNIILEDFKRLSSILDDFLVFTENKEIKILDFDVKKEVENLIEELKFRYKEIDKLNISFKGESSIFRANPYHISLILKNLLTNSIKAVNNRMYDIDVEISIDSKELVINVKDKGLGMEKNQLNHIFNPFYSNFNEGMGIGLTIVKRIVELYDGKIKVESWKNKGTVYNIVIPNKGE